MRRIHSLASLLWGLAASLTGFAGDRLVPALLTGAGVFLVSAGLWSYVSPLAPRPAASPSADVTAAASTPASFASPPPPPSGSPSASLGSGGVATRVVVPALNIDLPVIAAPPNEQFPLCGVAEYFTAQTTTSSGASVPKPLGYPGAGQATYLYAHARAGMFLPLLTASRQGTGQGMIGTYIEVYTADDERHVYEISEVRRHQPATAATLQAPLAATSDQLWLQTSEGPNETSTKLQVVATPVGVLPATAADAHPPDKGRVCPDAPICQAANGSGCRPR